jgi:hypothetical protein
MTEEDPQPDPRPAEDRSPGLSDLIGLKLTLALAVGFLAILAAFFFVGPVAGMVVLIVAVALAIVALVIAVRNAEVSD